MGGWDRPAEARPEDQFRLVPLVTAIRWATTAVSLILVSTENPTRRDGVIGAVLLSYALWRTIKPPSFSGRAGDVLTILAEGAAVLGLVIGTGYWESSYVFVLVTVISSAGFAAGIPFSVQVALACGVAVAVPYHVVNDTAGISRTVQWAGELLLVAMLSGYTRRLSLRARAETSLYVGRLRQLAEVNDLLLQLRNVAQTVPMSLDLSDTLDSSVARLQELFRPDTVVVLLRDVDIWHVARATGAQLPRQLPVSDLPPVLSRAVDSVRTVVLTQADDPSVAMLDLDARSGLYGRLSARDEIVGLVGVERRTEPLTEHDEVVMEEFCQQMAISVDNAQWFSRIGILAAEQERSRIARDLHDRVGQSLALVGYELDRVTRRGADPEVTAQLQEVREIVQGVVRELRDTLHDLRTDVSDEQDLPAALTGFLDRVAERSGLTVSFENHATQRLPLNVEREVWRIGQEAVFNAERHARASTIEVSWTSDGAGAELCVTDDGDGLPRSALTSGGGYGLLGMQERAKAIDGVLEFRSLPGAGTTVRLRVRR